MIVQVKTTEWDPEDDPITLYLAKPRQDKVLRPERALIADKDARE